MLLPLGIQLPTMLHDARFAALLNDEELNQLCTLFILKQTQRNSMWATGVFNTWLSTKNSTPALPITDAIPTDLLEVSYPIPVVDCALAAFVLEARRADGNFYPGNTLKNILSALFRVMKQNQGALNVISFVIKSERENNYPRLHNALDRILRLLWENGEGLQSSPQMLNLRFGKLVC